MLQATCYMTPMDPLPHGRIVTITAITASHILLTTDTNESLTWPKHLLPPTVEVGSSIHLLAFIEEDGDKERTRLAKALLTEMLRRKSDTPS